MRRVRHCMLCRMGESHFFARLRGPTRLDFAPQLTHVPLRAGCGGCGPRGLRAWRLLLCLRRRHTRLACPCCVCPRRRVCIAPRPLAPRGWRRCGRGHGHAARCCHQRFAPRAAERRSRRSCEAHASRNAATATALRQRATAGHRGRRARAAARAGGGGGARSGCGGRGSACARTAAEIKRAGARRPPAVRQRAAPRATGRHLDGNAKLFAAIPRGREDGAVCRRAPARFPAPWAGGGACERSARARAGRRAVCSGRRHGIPSSASGAVARERRRRARLARRAARRHGSRVRALSSRCGRLGPLFEPACSPRRVGAPAAGRRAPARCIVAGGRTARGCCGRGALRGSRWRSAGWQRLRFWLLRPAGGGLTRHPAPARSPSPGGDEQARHPRPLAALRSPGASFTRFCQPPLGAAGALRLQPPRATA
jgi:hypothetical protein